MSCCNDSFNLIKTTSQGLCADEMSRVITICGKCFKTLHKYSQRPPIDKNIITNYTPRKFYLK